MYNGIGLKTPRGSGTNGYVQRNLGFVRPRSSRPVYEDDGKRKEQTITKANKAILEHEKKREIEIQLIEMRDELEDQGVPDAEIDRRVDAKRATLFAAFEAQASSHSVRDADANSAPSFYELQSRGDLRMREETHAAAAAKEAENRRLEAALGISGFKEGASFDPEEQERRKEERKRRWEEAQRAKEEQSSRGRRSGVDDEQPSRGRVKRRRTSDRSSHSRSSSRSRSVSSRSRSASSSSSLSSRARSRSSRSTSRSRSASSSRSRSRSSASGSRSPSRSRSVSSRSEGSSRSRSRSASRSSGRRSRSRSPSPVAGMKGAEANNAPRDAPVRERSNESARQKGVSPSHGERSERQGGPGSQRGAPVSGDGFLRSAVGEIGEQGRQSSDEDREAVPDRPRLQSVIIVPERDPSPPRRPSGVRRFRSRSASRSYSRSRSPSRRYSRSRSRSASLSRSPSRSYSRSPSRSRSTARR